MTRMKVIPQRGKVTTAPTVPPLKANVTNFPFSDWGTHLSQKYPILDADQIEMLPTTFNMSSSMPFSISNISIG